MRLSSNIKVIFNCTPLQILIWAFFPFYHIGNKIYIVCPFMYLYSVLCHGGSTYRLGALLFQLLLSQAALHDLVTANTIATARHIEISSHHKVLSIIHPLLEGNTNHLFYWNLLHPYGSILHIPVFSASDVSISILA